MEWYHLLGIGATAGGAGLAILQRYLEYRQEKKLSDVNQKNKEVYSKLEQTLANMSPDELKKRLKIVE